MSAARAGDTFDGISLRMGKVALAVMARHGENHGFVRAHAVFSSALVRATCYGISAWAAALNGISNTFEECGGVTLQATSMRQGN